MARIQSSVGLITGIPIEETVNKLMALAAQPRDTLVARRTALQATQGAVIDLTALTLGVQGAARRLGSASLFSQRTVVSSNSALLTATATSAVPPGQFQFTPVRTAQSHHLVSSGLASRDQALGTGEITFRFGGAVNAGTSLDDLNGGEGVARGKIKITDRSGATAVIDLRYARTIDDVLAAINASEAVDVEAQAVGDHLQLVDQTGGSENLRVQEVSGGNTAADLGLAGINVAADSATGQDIVRIFPGLDLARLNDGNGLSLRPELPDLEVTFRDGSTPLAIDLDPVDETAPRTLQDLLDRINAADPARLAAQISADGSRIELTDLTANTGGTFAITSPVGGAVAAELGLTGAASGDTIAGRRLLSGLKTTLLTSLRGGSGLPALGEIDLTDRTGDTATVNLAGAETLDDVIAAINGSGLELRAEYNSARNGLAIVDTSGSTTSHLIVANGDGTNSATALGLASDVAANKIGSGSLARQVVSRNTLLSSYNGGAGIGSGTILITDSAGQARSLNLTQLEATTVGDVLDAINGLTNQVTASLNAAGDGILLTDTAGGTGTLTVSNVGSGRAATGLHLAGQATGTTLDGSTTLTVAIGADDTLEDLVTKINGLSAGVSASIFSDSTGSLRHHLSLLSNVSGLAGELLVDGTGAGLAFEEVAAAQDAVLQLGTGPASSLLTSSTNQFQDVVSGLNVSVSGAATEPVTTAVAATSEGAAGAIQTFVDQFNKLRDKLRTYTAFNADAGTKGTLFGSSEALRLDNDLSRMLTDRYRGLGDVQSLAELGVSIDDQGRLAFDKTRFQTRYAADPEAVENFFTDETLGFAKKADQLLERLVGRDNSVLVNRAAAISQRLEDFTGRIDTWAERLTRQRERLLNDFYRIEEVVSRLQNNLTAIGQIQSIQPLTSGN